MDLKNKLGILKGTTAVVQFTGSHQMSVNKVKLHKIKMLDGKQLIGTAFVREDEVEIFSNQIAAKLLYKSNK